MYYFLLMVYCVFREVLLQYVKVEGIIPPGVSQIIHFFQIRRYIDHWSTTFPFCETPTIFSTDPYKKNNFFTHLREIYH